jgi:hypothetical protein
MMELGEGNGGIRAEHDGYNLLYMLRVFQNKKLRKSLSGAEEVGQETRKEPCGLSTTQSRAAWEAD